MQKEILSAEKISIQSIDMKLNDYLREKIRKMTGRLLVLFPEVNWIDIYLKENQDKEKPGTMTIRFGVPGPDIIVTESGKKWKLIFKQAEKKLVRHLEKKKALWNQPKEMLPMRA